MNDLLVLMVAIDHRKAMDLEGPSGHPQSLATSALRGTGGWQ
jgi:hypothetical protein